MREGAWRTRRASGWVSSPRISTLILSCSTLPTCRRRYVREANGTVSALRLENSFRHRSGAQVVFRVRISNAGRPLQTTLSNSIATETKMHDGPMFGSISSRNARSIEEERPTGRRSSRSREVRRLQTTKKRRWPRGLLNVGRMAERMRRGAYPTVGVFCRRLMQKRRASETDERRRR